VTRHAKDALACTRIPQILNLPLAISTFEAGSAKGLVACENGEVFDLVTTGVAAICAVVAYERAVTEEQQVCVGVE